MIVDADDGVDEREEEPEQQVQTHRPGQHLQIDNLLARESAHDRDRGSDSHEPPDHGRGASGTIAATEDRHEARDRDRNDHGDPRSQVEALVDIRGPQAFTHEKL